MRGVFMIRQKKINFSVLVLIVLSIWLMGYSLFMTERTMETVLTSLRIFVRSIFPLLSVFSVCTKLFVKTNAFRRLIPVRCRSFLQLLGMSEAGFSVFLLGLFAGFPTGAMMLFELCEKGEISVKEAESLLPFCNQASIIFLFGTLGAHILGDPRMGFIFFFAQTTTAVACVCLTAHNRYEGETFRSKKDYSGISLVSALTSSVRETVFSMLGVCGFFVFFSLLGTALTDTLSAFGFSSGKLFCAMLKGILEMSSGFISLSSGSFSLEILLISGGVLLGFGGISVFMQAIDRTESVFFAPRKYFEGKVLFGVLCPIFSVLFFFLYEKKGGQFLIMIASVLIFLIFYLLNDVKIKFFSKKCGKIERNAV